MTLIAAAGIGLMASACSLRPPGGAGTYSSLPVEPTVSASGQSAPVAHAAAVVPQSDFEEAPSAAPAARGRAVSAARSGGVEPDAALSASERARHKWETLRPGDLVRAPIPANRAAAATMTGSVASAPAAKGEGYDRETAMQNLVNGGRSASKGICSGC
ncbi:hypothetical protein [Methylobacterium sp. J-076]|uniref:hypothetical protein n=1 Tax=Methylobacterium sp. J-076 TaxID=2836655 RepID=UPI001FB8E1CF|nr:hypothetical protein [Methylobacterium sp. J-076]MCJ2013660.1 hypothetical protein [Methylobacterium sp. J-076]